MGGRGRRAGRRRGAGGGGRRADREPREALLTLRWTPVTVLPPRQPPAPRRADPHPAGGDPGRGAGAAARAPPIRWRLLTTVPVPIAAAALQCVRCYAQRWLMERYHYVLKSGCRIEALQLRTTARLARALALYAIVAWRLLWLTYLARAHA